LKALVRPGLGIVAALVAEDSGVGVIVNPGNWLVAEGMLAGEQDVDILAEGLMIVGLVLDREILDAAGDRVVRIRDLYSALSRFVSFPVGLLGAESRIY
jgi:hypothetical protein